MPPADRKKNRLPVALESLHHVLKYPCLRAVAVACFMLQPFIANLLAHTAQKIVAEYSYLVSPQVWKRYGYTCLL